MASINPTFEQTLAKFKSRLTKKELENFEFSSLNDVQMILLKIQEEQNRQKGMMNLARIQRFLEAMEQYGQVIEVFLNASSILCFVWGPMKFCLQVASTWADSFDILLDAYQQLAENIPLLQQYHELFQNNSQMLSILSMIYEDILEFHRAALRVFTKPTWKQLFRATWKDFNTRFQHILNALYRHKALVESQASIIQMNKIYELQAEWADSKNAFAAIEMADRQNKRITVTNWLSAADARLDQEVSASIRCDNPSTGLWVLQDDKMKPWLDPNNQMSPMLWMNGMPGAGKTILTSLIIEESLKLHPKQVMFFFCKYQDEQRNTFISVARGILTQILNQDEDILPYLYDQCLSSGQVSLLSTQMCEDLLKVCLETISKTTYIIIDGIDECSMSERKAIISTFTSIIEKDPTPGRLRGLFVSQHENDIKRLFRTASELRLTDAHNKSDIETFAYKWSLEIQQKFELNEKARAYIVSAVCNGAEGMFLYAKLVLTNLYSQVSLEKLYEELQPGTFPKGFEQAYSRIVVRIYDNPKEGEREITEKLLGWITCAKRPLKWHEIQGAVSIDMEDESIDFENRRLCTHVRDLCGSLIDVLPGDRVQLVHETARSYLIHQGHVKVSIEERKLTVLCLRYLIFDCFDIQISDENILKYLKQGYYAFQDYAVLHWVDHLDALIQFLQSDDLEICNEIGPAISDFYSMYGENAGSEAIPDALVERCQDIKDSDYVESLMMLLNYSRKTRSAEDGITALGQLGTVVQRVRSTLENLFSSGEVAAGQDKKMNGYYGPNWYKCPRHACFLFHEGFADAERRDKHLERHEKPFCCTELSCPRIHLGFSTEKELKKHMSMTHPDPATFAWKFPKIAKPVPKHSCTICSKEFTRSSTLRIHLKTHANERAFKCRTCDKSFVRKHDCTRHEEKLHGGERQQIQPVNGETSSSIVS